MRWIKKNNPPNSFQTYTKGIGASYSDMDSGEILDLKNSLLNEQEGLCAYCQKKISMKSMTIEHHCEQSICNGENGNFDRRLDYKNLFAVCLGMNGKTDRHCDTSKGDVAQNKGMKERWLPIQVNPTINAHTRALKYNAYGTLSSTNERHDSELNKVLNLNAEFLRDLRSKEFKTVFALSKNNTSRMKRILKKRMDKNAPFKGMYEYMLQRFT
ncbi:MAG: hypothetical protein ACJAWV_003856 [Flammeovirgaceae bacterium]|jgi:uncharacterized protein (TIGR02646 family)